MAEDTSLRRQWLLLRSLISRRYGMTVKEMAAATGVTEKTIRRDLETFRSVGFSLEETIGEFGRKTWRIKGDGSQPSLTFTFEEAAALEFARHRLDSLAGTPFYEAAQNAQRKIRSSLSENVLEYLARFSGFFHQTNPGLANYSAKSEIFESLMIGIEDGKAVHILYQSERATEPAYRDVYPLGLILHKEWYYLIALDPQEDKVKHYKLDRIEEVEVSPFPLRRPEGFSLSEHLSSSFGIYKTDSNPITIKIRFARSVARYVQESKRHETQKLTKQRDGSVIAEFKLSSTEEIRGWVLSFGGKAVVLEPISFRRQLAEELAMLVRDYNSHNEITSRSQTKSS